MRTDRTLPPVLDMLRGVSGVSDALLSGLLDASVHDAEDLAWALATQRVRALADGDASAVRRIRRALYAWGDRPRGRSLREARDVALRVLSKLQQDENALRLAVTGAVRRMEPVVSSVELLATAHDPQALLRAFESLPFVATVLKSEAQSRGVRLDDGTDVTLHVEPEDPSRWFVRWVETTGPAEHVLALRNLAQEQGVSWTASGLEKNGEPVALHTEDDLYEALEVKPTIVPEARRANLNVCPRYPVGAADLRGVAHVHTRSGRGTASLEGVAERAGREGYDWVWVTDRGLDAEARQAQTIAARNWNLKRTESSLDEGEARPPVAIAGAEVPVGTVNSAGDLHAGMAVVESDDDARALVNVIEHTGIRVVAHPDARALSDWGHAIDDWVPVFAACRDHDVAVEFSGQVRRHAYPPSWHRAARAHRLKLLLGTDAYEPDDLDAALIALGQARRHDWSSQDVLNTLDADALHEWLGD